MRFKNFHPLTHIVYFSSVLYFSMISRNLVLLSISFLFALLSVTVMKKRSDILIYLSIFIIIALMNPFFSHNGRTVLFFFSGQRFTLEAVIFGIGAALAIISAIYWFKLFGIVFGTDKLSWAVGSLSPKLGIVLTMAMRFVPLFKENAENIHNAQKSLGLYDNNTFFGKVKTALNTFSALISLSIENAVETADTMRARGFRGGRKTSYYRFHMTKYDICAVTFIVLSDVFLAVLFAKGAAKFWYYPKIVYKASYEAYLLYGFFALLCAVPIINEIKEDLRWKYLISKI